MIFQVKYQDHTGIVQAEDASSGALLAARRWITKRRGLWVNGWSIDQDGNGHYQAYVPSPKGYGGSTSVGDTIKVQATGELINSSRGVGR